MTTPPFASLADSGSDTSPQPEASSGRVQGSVRACLAWADMCRIPRHYEDFSACHFRRLRPSAGLSWTDACPAYALAYLTHTAYRSPVGPGESAELQAQWEELRGTSALDWPQAFAIVQDAWTYLA